VSRWRGALLAGLIIGGGALPAPAMADTQQRTFESPEVAVRTLVDTLRKNDTKGLIEILGPESRPLIDSADPVADRASRAAFVEAYDRAHRLQGGGGKVVLYVGTEEFPMPIPLVPAGPVWRWDAAAGRAEVLRRRIGRNELSTIQVCLAYVDAQREYFREPRGADPVLQYAQHLASTPGRHDGLYWETRPDETPSPLGALVARARAEGYRPRTGARQEAAYHGYRYRILTAQGRSAPDGALDYIVGGRMIGGFALVASPLQYGVSGVMTFIVSHAAVVYQKDLGASSAAIALRITRFDPDPSWTKVTP
jgi:hypothetical protein